MACRGVKVTSSSSEMTDAVTHWNNPGTCQGDSGSSSAFRPPQLVIVTYSQVRKRHAPCRTTAISLACQAAGNHSGLAVTLRTTHSVFFVVALNCMMIHTVCVTVWHRTYGKPLRFLSSWTCAFLICPPPLCYCVSMGFGLSLLNQSLRMDIYLTENLE